MAEVDRLPSGARRADLARRDLAAADVVDRERGRGRAREAEAHRERARRRIPGPQGEGCRAAIDSGRRRDREPLALGDLRFRDHARFVGAIDHDDRDPCLAGRHPRDRPIVGAGIGQSLGLHVPRRPIVERC